MKLTPVNLLTKLPTKIFLMIGVYTLAILDVSALPSQQLNDAFKKAVRENEPKLGTLEVWQKKIFDEEVISLSPRFIHSYKQTSRGVNAEVDIAEIKKYLTFYAPISYENPKGPTLKLSVRAEETCPECIQALDVATETIKRRVGRRGFKILEESKAKKTDATLVVWLKRLPLREAEVGHEDERGFRVELTFSSKDYTQEKKADLLMNDAFDAATSSVLTEWASDMSLRRFASSPTEGMATGPTEVLFEMRQIRDLAHFNQLKALLQSQVQAAFGEQSFVVIRKQSQGVAVFALPVNSSVNDPRAMAEKVVKQSNWMGAQVVIQ